MAFNFDMIRSVYDSFTNKVKTAQTSLNRSLTLAEKILYAHLPNESTHSKFMRGENYACFLPDRVAMQDATAQMALLQFMLAEADNVAVPTTVHCDHLIQAYEGAEKDLKQAKITNKEVYDFLASASNKYGIDFWEPGAGIIHQILLENYAFPGGMMIGTDSHTPNAGGLGMIAIGVGGADAVDVMAGMQWELLFPKMIGINLTGKLHGWVSPKDVILEVARRLSVKGGTGAIIEYFGEGAKTISATGKATICNMGAEVGATTSLFGYDDKMDAFLRQTGRSEVADAATGIYNDLVGDPEVYQNPEKYYDQVIEIDLSSLEPHINGPFSPDRSYTISEIGEAAKENGYPEQVSSTLIGSCTNSSYEDISRAASLAKQAIDAGIKLQSEFLITPGSQKVKEVIERDGLLDILKKAGGTVLANACGPCIGQWLRPDADKHEKNTIVNSFNRNFAKRNDGNPNTYAFVASPEIVTAFAFSGSLRFNPLTDSLTTPDGQQITFNPPQGNELPENGFATGTEGYQPPAQDGSEVNIIIKSDSDRLQKLEPFPAWDGNDLKQLRLLLKAKSKCTTDHISMAGPWLKYRGHLDNISNNLFIGAVNYFTDTTNWVKHQLTGEYKTVPEVARSYKNAGIQSIVVADENYGEGSSREHAAMEPRYMGVRVVLARSFARIHENNLKKQGILALTFANKEDYDAILEDDVIDIIGLHDFAPGKPLTVRLHHQSGQIVDIAVQHSYSQNQIEWFKAGSAINVIRNINKGLQ